MNIITLRRALTNTQEILQGVTHVSNSYVIR